MTPEAPSVDALLSVGGASLVTTLIVQFLLKPLFGAKFDWPRFGPLVAIVTATALVLIATFALGLAISSAAIVGAFLTGLFAGLAAIGLYEAALKPTVNAISKPPGG